PQLPGREPSSQQVRSEHAAPVCLRAPYEPSFLLRAADGSRSGGGVEMRSWSRSRLKRLDRWPKGWQTNGCDLWQTGDGHTPTRDCRFQTLTMHTTQTNLPWVKAGAFQIQ